MYILNINYLCETLKIFFDTLVFISADTMSTPMLFSVDYPKFRQDFINYIYVILKLALGGDWILYYTYFLQGISLDFF